MELKGLKVNIKKTTVMRSGKSSWRDNEDWKMAMCSVWERCRGKPPFNAVIAVDGFTRDVVVPDVFADYQSFRCRICLTDEGVRSEGERMENLNLENGKF